ncbi:MAG TPA: hypothetical protein VD929_09935 [Caulobacteraceae bacterium]|nr:hypothetical protein [Caulobacteraceae bacterium]
MAEEGFVRLYVRDFSSLAAKAATGQEVEPALAKRIEEARSHAAIMDARKSPGHLDAVSEALKVESERKTFRDTGADSNPEEVLERRRLFLLQVADRLKEGQRADA